MADNLKEIIEKAKVGDEEARTQLIALVKDNGAMQQINRYLYMNRLLEPKDVQSEFWLGVIKAIPIVKHDIGNPLQFLVWRGINQIRIALTKVINKNVSYSCFDCGHIGMIRKVEGKQICHKCKGENIETYQIGICSLNADMSKLSSSLEKRLAVETKDVLKIDLEEFEKRLSIKEREVFNLILDGTDRDNTINYLKDIGQILNVSPQRITALLRSIRIKLSLFIEK